MHAKFLIFFNTVSPLRLLHVSLHFVEFNARTKQSGLLTQLHDVDCITGLVHISFSPMQVLQHISIKNNFLVVTEIAQRQCKQSELFLQNQFLSYVYYVKLDRFVGYRIIFLSVIENALQLDVSSMNTAQQIVKIPLVLQSRSLS